jgi:hypothetical protein
MITPEQAKQNVKDSGGLHESILDDIEKQIDYSSKRGYMETSYMITSDIKADTREKVVERLKSMGYNSRIVTSPYGGSAFINVSWS